MSNDRKGFASDYIDVATRIQQAKAIYPELSLQSEILSMTDSIVVVRCYAYRTPDDQRPGIGHAWEAIPGRTPFTKGSELMVAETGGWGRALAAIGMATKGGIATAEEVRAAQDRQAKISDFDSDELVKQDQTMLIRKAVKNLRDSGDTGIVEFVTKAIHDFGGEELADLDIEKLTELAGRIGTYRKQKEQAAKESPQQEAA